jgi:hypothetical protein
MREKREMLFEAARQTHQHLMPTAKFQEAKKGTMLGA